MINCKQILEEVKLKRYQTGGNYYNQPYNYQYNYIPSMLIPEVAGLANDIKNSAVDGFTDIEKKNIKNKGIQGAAIGAFGVLNGIANQNYYKNSLERQNQLNVPNYTQMPIDRGRYASGMEDMYQANQVGGKIEVNNKSELKGLDPVSMLGYSDNSPYKERPYNDIYSPHLTMKNTFIPLRGISDTGEVKSMYPGIDYFFKNASRVREIPMYQDGGMEEMESTDESTNSNEFTGQYTYNTFEPANQELPDWYLESSPELDFGNDYETSVDLDELERQVKQRTSYSPYQSKVDNQGNAYYASTAPNPNGKSVSIRNNTLLNFKYKPWMSEYGARVGEIAPEKDGTRFAAFDNIEDSTKVYKKLMRGSGYANLTVKDGLKKYAAGTYPSSIYSKVSNILNKKIGDLSEAELNQLMKVQALHEDNTQYRNYYGK